MPHDFDMPFAPEVVRAMILFSPDDISQMEEYRSVGYFVEIPKAQVDLGEIATRKGRRGPLRSSGP